MMENVYELLDLFENVTPIINVYICELFEIADSRGKCKYDEYGDCYLDKIPEDKLCESVLAALNKEGLFKLYEESFKKINSYKSLGYNEIKKQVKNILTWCFTMKCKDDEKNVRIIAHTVKDENIKIPFFHALSFYKFVYEFEDIQDLDKFYNEHIKIPCKSNILLMDVNLKKVKNVYSLDERERWYKDMKKFMKEEADKKEWNSFREDIELDRIKRRMPYLEKE